MPTETPGSVTFATTDVTGGTIYSRYNSAQTTVFMDRDLGATDITEFHKGIGYLYQSGRKDLFTHREIASGISGPNPIYNMENVLLPEIPRGDPLPSTPYGLHFVDTPSSPEGNNLKLSVQNPLQYYIGSTNNLDWYSGTTDTHDFNLWLQEDGYKGDYDPCPAGWRIPMSGSGTLSPWYKLTKVTGLATDPIDLRDQGYGYVFQAGQRSGTTGEFTVWGAAYCAGTDTYKAVSSTLTEISRPQMVSWRLLPRNYAYVIRCAKDGM